MSDEVEAATVPEYGILMKLVGPRRLKSDRPNVTGSVGGRGIEAPPSSHLFHKSFLLRPATLAAETTSWDQ